MSIEPLSKALGGLPGAGGNPWVGLVYVVSLITGAGLVRFMFFTVRRNERGVWLRLGNVVYRRDGRPKILRPGHAAMRFPFVWRLVKVSVNIRTNATADIETTRTGVGPGRQKWEIRCDVNWRVQTGAFRVARAALRAQDLEETVTAIVCNAIQSSIHDSAIEKLESHDRLRAAVRRRCKGELAGLGVALTGINIIKYAPVDAQIIADSIQGGLRLAS